MPHIAFRLDDQSAKQLKHVLGMDGVTLSRFARRAICAAIAERLIAYARCTASKDISPDLAVGLHAVDNSEPHVTD